MVSAGSRDVEGPVSWEGDMVGRTQDPCMHTAVLSTDGIEAHRQ